MFSVSRDPDSNHEQLLNLYNEEPPPHHHHHSYPPPPHGDGRGNKIWRESINDMWGDEGFSGNNAAAKESFNFRHKGMLSMPEEHPLSWLIRDFLYKQIASDDISLDMDIDMEELKPYNAGKRKLPIVSSKNPILKELKVSFEGPATPNVVAKTPNNDPLRRRHNRDSPLGGEFQRPLHNGRTGCRL